MPRSLFLALALVVAGPLCVPQAGPVAAAQTLEWEIRSLFPGKVLLEFYSQHEDRTWPGEGMTYVLDDRNYHTFRLDCTEGELICYGAWAGDRYWGVGEDRKYGCDNCCRTCGWSYTRATTLRK